MLEGVALGRGLLSVVRLALDRLPLAGFAVRWVVAVSQLSDSSDSIRRGGGRVGDGLEYVHIEIVHIVPLDLKRLLLVVDVDR